MLEPFVVRSLNKVFGHRRGAGGSPTERALVKRDQGPHFFNTDHRLSVRAAFHSPADPYRSDPACFGFEVRPLNARIDVNWGHLGCSEILLKSSPTLEFRENTD